MPVEPQTLINLVGGAVLATIGWLARQLWDAVEELKRDLHAIEVDLPSNYIKKDEFIEATKEIKDMLNKIFDKLDHKVDK
jgi:hypothetical protein